MKFDPLASIFREGGVRIAIEPALVRLGRRNNGMSARMSVFAGVAIWRTIAAQRYAAGLTRAQMDP